MTMVGVARARARAAHMDPARKRLIRETQNRNRKVERRLVRAIEVAEGSVLGVGLFSRPVARALMRVKADVLDERPWNPEANLFADLADGGSVLSDRYQLIVSQDGLCGGVDTSEAIESFSTHLAAGGRMIVIFQTKAPPGVSATRLRRSLRQVVRGRGSRLLLLDREAS